MVINIVVRVGIVLNGFVHTDKLVDEVWFNLNLIL